MRRAIRHVRPACTVTMPGAVAGGFAVAICLATTVHAATVTVRYPVPGDGFSSNAPADPSSPAPGNTLGAQRRATFEAAAEEWGSRLDSDVPIRIDAEMVALSCNAGGAILGAAGPLTVSMNWEAGRGGSAPAFADTWYHAALANKIANLDLDASSDVIATFNSSIDNNNACLSGVNWYYATTIGPAPPGTISFFMTVLHEIGHGVGVSTFVNASSGIRFFESDDIFMRFLEDDSRGVRWNEMSADGRAASAVDSGDLVWAGPAVTAAAGRLTAGTVGGRVRMYAPNPVQLGSSVSHFDTAVTAAGVDELMEPFATGKEGLLLVEALLADIGWGDAAGTGPVCGDGVREGDEQCDDGNVANGDCCSSACVLDAPGMPCNDGNLCTTGDTCAAGSCTPGTTVTCNDGNDCTDDACDPSSGCSSSPNTDACDDGDPCTSADRCSAGICSGVVQPGCGDGTPCAACDDGNACTADLCMPDGSCSYGPRPGPCDDGDACTTGDTCTGTTCAGTIEPGCSDGTPCAECGDGNPCTDDLCLAGGGCANPVNSGPCEDGNPCTRGDMCVAGSCTPGAARTCSDANPCTDDWCDPTDGCHSRANSIACDDGDPCTTGDTCRDGVCVGSGSGSCDDGNPCTSDSCAAPGGCVHLPRAGACDDGNACTAGDRCIEGRCIGGTTVDCDDGNQCTRDSCDPLTGTCLVTFNVSTCDDGNACTQDDTCSEGICRGDYMVGQCCGDANSDGSLAATDTLIILSRSIGRDVDCPIELCDVDASGDITASDALSVLREVVGVDTVLECTAASASRTPRQATSSTSTTSTTSDGDPGR